MIMTSYYANKDLKHLTGKFKLMGISQSAPRWYRGESFKYLAPPWELVKLKDDARYTHIYRSEILAKLDAWKVAAYLDNCVLLCWEKPGEFCHRRLVAEWLQAATGKKVPEFVWTGTLEESPNEQLSLFGDE